MKRVNSKILATCLAASMVISTTNFTTKALAAEKTQISTVSRNSSKDRCDKALEISRAHWSSSDTVVIGTEEDFGDELDMEPSGEEIYNAPILLTKAEGLSIEIVKEIVRLGAKKIIIAGEIDVIPQKIEDALKKIGSVQRISGKDRYEIFTKIAEKIGFSKHFKKVTSVTLNKTTIVDLQVGTGAIKKTEQLTATIAPANATIKNVIWISSNKRIATVSTTGLVTAVGAGSATVTVISVDGLKIATCKITVSEVTKVTGVTLNMTTVSDLQVGTGATKKTQQLIATITPTNATNKNVTWTSSDIKVATVNAIGLVAAVGVGSATITVTTADGGKTANSIIKVTGSSDQNDSLWSPKFLEDFSGTNGTGVDTSKWNYDLGNNNGWGNSELESYTNSTNNVFQKDGSLVIKATKADDGTISSGRITTKDKVTMKYGRVDVRAKLPVGTGLWPAIWMMPQSDKYGGWAASGELDIMENKGRLPGEEYGTLHYGATWPNNKYSGATYTFPQGQTVADYHVYSMEWEPGEIRWYVDGHIYQTQNNWNTNDNNGEKYSFPAPFDQDFFIILNLAYGGNFDGGQKDDTKLPGEMLVDYVHTYDLTGRAYKTPVEPQLVVAPLPAGAKEKTADGNLLSNGDFSQAVQDNYASDPTIFSDKWNFVYGTGGIGTQVVETINGKNYEKVNITAGGSNNYSVQLIQETTIGKGRWYKVSFDSKASDNRTIGMKVGGGPTRGYSAYSNAYNFNLTTSFTHFERYFQMTADTDLIARLEFELGLNTNSVWIGNARIDELSQAPDLTLANGNLIHNGAFDKGTIDRMANWNLSTNMAAATASVAETTRELKATITSGGTAAEAIILSQGSIPLLNGKNYKLSFKARGDAGRTIKVGLQSSDGSITYLADKSFDLTTTMQIFTLSCNINSADDSNAKLVFKLGGDNSNIYLDDVFMKQDIDYSKVDIYPLKNGDFSLGANGLMNWELFPNTVGDAASSISVENGEVKIAITNPGAYGYSIMLNQGNMNLSNGVEYKIAFDARSTADRNILVTAENATYKAYLSKTIALSATTTHYEYTFVMPNDDNVALKIQMGKVDANVPAIAEIFIDNVQFEVNNPPVAKAPSLVASSINNIVGQVIEMNFTDDAKWRAAISNVKINGTSLLASKYGIAAGKITFTADNFQTVGLYTIAVVATGYADTTVVQNVKANSDNLVTNGTFETDVTGWQSYTGDGSDAVLSSVNGEMNISFTNYGGWFTWSTQVYQDKIQLKAGKIYILKFDARSSVARDAWMEMNNLTQQTLALTDTGKTFTYEFTANAASDNAKLNFLLGTNNLDGALFTKNQTVTIDNISITEKK